MRRTFLLLCLAPLVIGCYDSLSAPDYGPAVGNAASFGIWTPGPNDNCTAAQHDAYSVVGPDHKRYPTWHPPIDPVSGCSFGHDHGRDPRGSALYRMVGAIPFGYANEQLDVYDPLTTRHEDHFGHKVEWENDVRMHFGSDAADAMFDIRCDVLTKLHQGTHSKDAFTNNLHELAYHIRCTDGTELHVTFLAQIGTPGEFVRSCDGATIVVGTASPPNSPAGGGERIIPDRTCVDQDILVPAGQFSDFGTLHESWQTSNVIRADGGHTLAAFNPYFQVSRPSRFYDPALVGLVGRPIDVCYEVTPTGERARGQDCDVSTANGTIMGVTFDDPRSVFDGVSRVVDINSNFIDNAGGPQAWYTDPFGKHGRTQPFPGSIRQFIASINNDRGGLEISGPTLGRNRDYGGPRVHAPN
ncbi:MAG TPA: hypothetical protein VGQ06_04235 [Gemmatimonadales bacterium]|jgi:hypothetical protein|nr:hypothetical protein [Gemmatimonadales bacterium]